MGVQQSGTYATPRLDLGEALKEYMFSREDFVGTSILTPFLTPKRDGNFPVLRREGLLRRDDVKRGPGGAYGRGDFDAEDKSYACIERGHEQKVDHATRSYYASDFDADLVAAEMAMFRVLLDQEVDIRDAIINTTTYTTGNGRRTDVAAAWGTATTNILADVYAGKESVRNRTGMDANVMVIGAVDLPKILGNNGIREAIQPTQLPTLEVIIQALGALFGLRVLVGKGVYNSAKEGQTASLTNIWGTGWAWIGRVASEGEGLQMPCIGRTMVWQEDSPDAVMAEQYEEPQTRSTIIRARSFCDELEIDPDFGQLLDTAA